MNNEHAFYDRLRRVKASSQASDDAGKLQQQWLLQLDELFQKLGTWLEPGVKEGLLQLSPGRVELTEESLGTYTAPTLTVELPGHLRVRLEPVGAEILGGHTGRVDLISGPNKARLLREASGEWVLGIPSLQFGRLVFDLKPLTEESFLEALDGLTA
jgi:hypothetical protein